MSDTGRAASYVLLSAIGVSLVSLAAVARSPWAVALDSTSTLLVGGTFVAACGVGFSLAVRPNWYRRSRAGAHRAGGAPDPHAGRPRRGHHPDCVAYRGHVLRVRGRDRCAACTGLAAGALAAMALMLAHVAIGPDIPSSWVAILIPSGVSLVALSFAETARRGANSPWIHAAGNAVLPVGFLLFTLGSLLLSGEATFGLLAVVVSFLLLDSRVQLSNWRHAAMRRACGEVCRRADLRSSSVSS